MSAISTQIVATFKICWNIVETVKIELKKNIFLDLAFG